MGIMKWHFVGWLPDPADWRYLRNTLVLPLAGGAVAAVVTGTAAGPGSLEVWEFARLCGGAFALSSLGLFVPFLFARAIAALLLPRFERGLRSVVATAIFLVLFLLNTAITAAINPTSPILPRAFSPLFGHGPSLFQAARLLLVGALVASGLWRLARDPVNQHPKPLRLLGALALVGATLFADWWLTRETWSVHPSNQEHDARHEVAIVIPQLDVNGLKFVLADGRLADWKEHQRFFAEIIPGNRSTIGELVTLVTGAQPWEHGLRDNNISPYEEKMLEDFLAHNSDQQNSLPFHRTLGATFPIAGFFDKDAPRPCARSRANERAVAAFSWMFPLYAQIPEPLAARVIPAYSCSPALAPMATLVEQSLGEFASLFHKPAHAKALWVLNLPILPGEDELTRLLDLADALRRFRDILATLNLDRNTRVTLVGLGGGRGSIAVISDFETPGLASSATSVLQVGTAQAAAILKGELPARDTLFYSEEIAPSPKPRAPAELAHDVFMARRTLRCSWREANTNLVALFHLTPTYSGIITTSEELGGVEVVAPILTNRSECAAAARRSMEALVAQDVSLLDPRPLEALFRRNMTRDAWAAPTPPLQPTPSPPSGGEKP